MTREARSGPGRAEGPGRTKWPGRTEASGRTGSGTAAQPEIVGVDVANHIVPGKIKVPTGSGTDTRIAVFVGKDVQEGVGVGFFRCG